MGRPREWREPPLGGYLWAVTLLGGALLDGTAGLVGLATGAP